MYSEGDLSAAVTAGVLTEESVAAFRAFIAKRRATSAVDEEHFRLLTGFNDIFVSIACALILWPLGYLGHRLSPVLGSLGVVAASWALAEFFTRNRRMALPSIILLLTFVTSLYGVAGSLLTSQGDSPAMGQMVLAASAGAAAFGAGLHWWRFRVPITVAAGTGAAIAVIVAGLSALVPDFFPQWGRPTLLMAGLATFAMAVRWDSSDRARVTRRSDVAFWLHLLAAPLIVHPAFWSLGLLGETNPTVLHTASAIALYLALGLVAVLVDRRALLVSALAYVIYALSHLVSQNASISEGLAVTALIVGTALTVLSAFWHNTRMFVLSRLPGNLRRLLPNA
ncbi:MAG TPA: hypothetical protein VM661_19230 [Candidatus Sulfotelmatobacter sp.]|jgi:hypothetical protein|nr:hypothetical protein [Candidatus Sulfotelmatobacter sp.]